MLRPAAVKHYPAAIETLAATVKTGGEAGAETKKPPCAT